MSDLVLSIVAPAHNEQDNVVRLVEEVERAGRAAAARLAGGAAGVGAGGVVGGAVGAEGGLEFILVDDGSTDQTRARAVALMAGRPWLRVVAMQGTPPGRGNGQSAAFHAAFRAARGRFVAVLDADLQNDPADLAAMAELLRREGADMVQGDRSANRRDNLVRRVGSRVGRAFRRGLLGDTIRDTGCSLRLMRAEVARALPLEFRGMHRFIPATARHLGFKVVEMPVTHRPRVAGETKYGLGITKRAIPGLLDLLAVRWMRSRRRPVGFVEVSGERPASAGGVVVRAVEVKPAAAGASA
ncbi:MAG: glycosyltransferase [Phycisphaerales bacterium]|nr:glycosyltransferase [Phycisphaerales bacterium]